jgi:hypothetical protein
MGPNKLTEQINIAQPWEVARSLLTDILRGISRNVNYLRDGYLFQERTLTSTATMIPTDSLLLCNGTFTFTLLPAQQWVQRRVTVKNIGVGTITVDASGAETIDGAANYVIAVQYNSICLFSDGTSIWIV